MVIKQLKDEDFVNYKKPSMFIAFPSCTFKCERECGLNICQNSELVKSKDINIELESLVNRYLNNHISQSIVLGGLEPMDSFNELLELVYMFRKYTEDDIVIYTGYYKNEILDKVNILSQYKNIVIKYGRFVPNQDKHYDNVLGVQLASCNQYAERIS